MRIEPAAPWPRQALTREEWAHLASGPKPPLLALWADTREVYALLREPDADPMLVSTPVEEGAYPALSPVRPLSAWFERMVHDLWGHAATGGADQRPWLDHGRWLQEAPLSPRPGMPGKPVDAPEFVASEDADQIPIGPVRGVIEPAAHLRLIGHGESIARLETRLGYTHKGTLALMRGKSPRAATRFAARLSAEATVAHSIAFARATEAALECEVPPRAAAWRGVMAEIERITSHLDTMAAAAEAVESEILAVRCAWHCEAIRRATSIAFEHRLMMDCVIPGGVTADAAPGGPEAIGRAMASLAAELPEIEGLIPRRLSGIGRVTAVSADSGVIGRAAGHAGDLRVSPGYSPYVALPVSVPELSEGDATARARIRLMEIGESIRVLRHLFAALPEGAVVVPLASESGEGIGFAEAPSGEVWHWLRLDHGQIASVFMCDPAWRHWPLLEAVMAGGQVDDLRPILASLGLSSSGADL